MNNHKLEELSMNKTLAAVLILAALPLVGCAGPEITAEDASMANAAALSRNYCVDARSRGRGGADGGNLADGPVAAGSGDQG